MGIGVDAIDDGDFFHVQLLNFFIFFAIVVVAVLSIQFSVIFFLTETRRTGVLGVVVSMLLLSSPQQA